MRLPSDKQIKQISVRVSPSTHETLTQLAKRFGVTHSELVELVFSLDDLEDGIKEALTQRLEEQLDIVRNL